MNTVREGDVYKIIELCGKRFELKYGFYEDYERESEFGEPIPIYPDFTKAPIYTDDGYPFVTQMQNLCEYGESRVRNEACCVDCKHFRHGDELIGLCQCEERRIASKSYNDQPHSISLEDVV